MVIVTKPPKKRRPGPDLGCRAIWRVPGSDVYYCGVIVAVGRVMYVCINPFNTFLSQRYGMAPCTFAKQVKPDMTPFRVTQGMLQKPDLTHSPCWLLRGAGRHGDIECYSTWLGRTSGTLLPSGGAPLKRRFRGKTQFRTASHSAQTRMKISNYSSQVIKCSQVFVYKPVGVQLMNKVSSNENRRFITAITRASH
jgi:hypothetical protein